MTASHYIENHKKLGLDRYKGLTVGEILSAANQSKLTEYF